MCGRSFNILTALIVLLFASKSRAIFYSVHEERDDVLQLIAQAGYEGAAYYVEPEDRTGWMLKMHRILPRGNAYDAQPVFLMHGIFAASADYVVTGRSKALAYLLADNNYDVYLGNARGNRHARVTRDANFSTLWNFSFHEIGVYDVAAMIDRALQISGREKLFYVGHSQGTSCLLALLSTRPKYNEKIVQAHLLAPIGFMKYLPNPLLRELIPPLMKLFERLRVIYVNFSDIFLIGGHFTRVLCDSTMNSFTTEICKAIIYAIVGTNTYQEEIDVSILPTLIGHISPKVSAQQLVHYAQLHQSGKFRLYDFKERNVHVYGTSQPPNYQLSNIVTSLYIYRAPEDLLASRRDVEHLVKQLKNTTVRHFRVVPNFNHLDFTYGRRTRKVLYNEILDFFNKENAAISSNSVRQCTKNCIP